MFVDENSSSEAPMSSNIYLTEALQLVYTARSLPTWYVNSSNFSFRLMRHCSNIYACKLLVSEHFQNVPKVPKSVKSVQPTSDMKLKFVFVNYRLFRTFGVFQNVLSPEFLNITIFIDFFDRFWSKFCKDRIKILIEGPKTLANCN